MRVTNILVLVTVLLSPQIASAGSVSLAWNANAEPELVGYYVCYGTTSKKYTTQVDVGNVISYAVSNLPAKTYYFAVKAYGIEGLESALSKEVSATVGSTDMQLPAISSVASSGITSTAAAISWITNEAANTQIEYGAATSYGSSTTLNSTLSTSHSQTLSGLIAGTTYHYRVKSRDAAGNLATSPDYTFITASPYDTTAPTISSVASSRISNTTATISWSTNEAANTQVEYGTTKSYGNSTTLNSALSTSHSQVLSGLTAGATYHYRVKSRDAAGNLATSPDYTFVATSLIDISSGLVAAYGFDEGKGTKSADYSGNDNSATLYSASWHKGKYGQSLYFNGTASYVSASTAGLPNMSQPKTISFWVYLTTLSSSIQSIVGLANPAMNTSVHYGVKSTLAGVIKNNGQWMTYSRVPSQFVWHHIAYVFDGSSNDLYLDGSLLCSSTITATAAPVTVFELARWAGGTNYFKGFIDDVRIYSRALSEDELSLVMKTPVSAEALDTMDTTATSHKSESNALSASKTRARARSADTPAISLDLEDRRYKRRETVKTSSMQISNPSAQSEEVELKTWIALPGAPPVPLGGEGDDSIRLAPRSNYDYANLPVLEIASDAPPASGEIGARLLNPITGDILSEDIKPFEIGTTNDSHKRPELLSDLILEALEDDRQPIYQVWNVGTDPAAAELKLWLETAKGRLIPILAPGADGSFVLPAGAHITFAPLAGLKIPAGKSILRTRLLDPTSGELIAEYEQMLSFP